MAFAQVSCPGGRRTRNVERAAQSAADEEAISSADSSQAPIRPNAGLVTHRSTSAAAGARPPINTSPNLILITDGDLESRAVLQCVAERLGCDPVDVNAPDELAGVLAMRRPNLAVLAVDRFETDGLGVLDALAQHGVRPATLLVGSVDARILSGIRRAAESRGLHIIGTRKRPLEENDIERLFTTHLAGSAPISREDLERAIAECEFSLRYQPKIALSADDLNIIGVEALVRWQHPRRGELLPGQFLAAVEELGLLGQLTDLILMEAARQAGAWRCSGMPLEMVVNLSPRLVRDREFPERLAVLLRENDVPPSQVVLDVTEATNVEDGELMLDVFSRLRILGVGLSLDNFGTGASSLTELYKMPYSEIKVDRVLLKDVARERDAETIVRAISSLAHDLELTVCAEGVETRQELDFVRSAGFDTAQGRFFCAPVHAVQIENLVRTWPRAAAAAGGALQLSRPSGYEDSSITRSLRILNRASTKG